MPKIFISYRRADSRKDAGRIYDRLVDAFGKDAIFKDVDSIPLGADFRGILREAVAQCEVQLVVIGKQWLDIRDESGARRLDQPGDFVRIEVETALQRDSCTVIPVLVDGAHMPKPDDLPIDLRELAFQNAATVRDDPDFHPDVSKIVRALGGSEATKPQPAPVAYDVHAAISAFYRAFDAADWEGARQLLTEIRASGKAPRVFDLDAHEREVWDAIEAAERDREYALLRLMATRPNQSAAWAALQVFWQSYPDHDPDGLAAQVRPQPVAPVKPPLEASADAIRAIIGDPFAWCEVPAGEFLYGDDKRKLDLDYDFAIAKYPITYSQFERFIQANDGFQDARWWAGLASRQPKQPGEQEWKIDDHPRENVDWYGAIAFCRWLSFKLGGGLDLGQIDQWAVRLPTEFEWEKAARGTKGLLYPYGNEFDAKKCNTRELGIGKTTPVTAYPQGASPYGAFDMSGNVWEWCLTDYDNPQLVADAENISSNNDRVLRGGSWVNLLNLARAAYRVNYLPFYRYNFNGFRVVCLVSSPI